MWRPPLVAQNGLEASKRRSKSELKQKGNLSIMTFPAGHKHHNAGHGVEMCRDRFWISLALTIPTLVWSHMIQEWFGFRVPPFPGSTYIPTVPGMMTPELPCDQRFVLLQPRGHARVSRRSVVVGAGNARHHHVARALDRDAVDLSGEWCDPRTREAPAKHRAANRRRAVSS